MQVQLVHYQMNCQKNTAENKSHDCLNTIEFHQLSHPLPRMQYLEKCGCGGGVGLTSIFLENFQISKNICRNFLVEPPPTENFEKKFGGGLNAKISTYFSKKRIFQTCVGIDQKFSVKSKLELNCFKSLTTRRN